MDSLDKKVVSLYKGKVVRKDLTIEMKKAVNVPSFVMEYLLGMYCSTDDEALIQVGIKKIKKILSENCVSPEQSEFIKSKIYENGEYTIIDKISVRVDEREGVYIAQFSNLRIAPFVIKPDLVVTNEKMLLGGIWCLVKIVYEKQEENADELFDEMFEGNRKRKSATKKKSKYDSHFWIESIKPIQMPYLNLDDFVGERQKFTTDEWISLLLRSEGYEPLELSTKQKLHYLLRVVPMIQKNYNLVELGPRGTGKSHVYSELSPYSILMSGGYASIASLFYNLTQREIGLVGKWDTIAFDEVGGLKHFSSSLNFMKNYMANGTFARDKNAYSADASFAFEGNTFKSVYEMIRTTNLFEPFPQDINNDSAFFDRIHAYLPGWETPKLKSSLFTEHYGLITDCFSEFLHEMRKFDFSDKYTEYFSLNKDFNVRDEQAVSRTFSGLAKLIFPDGKMTKDEVRMILEYAIECRRRVKEQLKKMTPIEFNSVELGYIDNETGEEYIVDVPERAKKNLIPTTATEAGKVYAIGRSIRNVESCYCLEFKLINGGNGQLKTKNIEGIGVGSRVNEVRTSISAGFNSFKSTFPRLCKYIDPNIFDYSLFFNDLQSKGVSEEVTVAEVIGLCSATMNCPVKSSLAVVGRVVMSGTMMPLSSSLAEILMVAVSSGAKTVLLPREAELEFVRLPSGLKGEITGMFYSSPLEAAQKALGLED